MKHLFPHHRARLSQSETMSVPQQLALTNVQSVQHRLVRWKRNIRLLSFFVGMLLVVVILPASPVRQSLGLGGGSGLINPICGHPSQVFTQLRPGATYTLPTSEQLKHLPTPKQRPISNVYGATYDPRTDQLCVADAAALDAHFGPATSTLPTTITSGNSGGLLTGGLVSSILGGLFTSFLQWVRDFLQSILDAAVSFGFMFTTPMGITYGHAVVKNLNAWMVLLTNSAIVLFLVIGGYKYMFLGDEKNFRELVPKLIMAAIVANFSLPILGQFIEVSNTVCRGIFGVLATAGIGDLKLPLGLINWATAPDYLIIVYLIELGGAVLFSGQMLMRVVFLCVLLTIAPFGLFLCFGASFVSPGARTWGYLWAQAFVATLIAQPLQLLCLGLGAALVGSFGHASISPISIVVGIAALFLAGKIPDMLLANVLRARILSSETANDFGEQVASIAQTGAEMAAILAV